MALPRVENIFIAPKESAPMEAIDEAEAVPGCGLRGDRNFLPQGYDAPTYKPAHEITLIEAEAVEGARRDYGLELAFDETRRNLLTRGAYLNHFVGQRFGVGNAILEGIELCEPCGHLEKLTRKGVRKALVHRGGLRARIVKGAVIAVGAPIRPLGPVE